MFRQLAICLVLLGMIIQPAATQDECNRVTIRFTAEEATTIKGKLGVRYTDGDGNNVRFVDFHISERDLDAGEGMNVGAFTALDVDDIQVILNKSELHIDGGGDFSIKKRDCSDSLPRDDGRLNGDDLASLTIVYANTQTKGYDLYAVDAVTGVGRLVVRASRSEIDAARAAATALDGANTLIGAQGNVSLWALTSGECQMNAFYADGKPNVFVFDCKAEG